jgi:hypothetical protein
MANPKMISEYISKDISINNGLLIEKVRPELLYYIKGELEREVPNQPITVVENPKGEQNSENIIIKIGNISQSITSLGFNNKKVQAILRDAIDNKIIAKGEYNSLSDIIKIIIKNYEKELELYNNITGRVNIEAHLIFYAGKTAIVCNRMKYHEKVKVNRISDCTINVPNNKPLEQVAKEFNNNEITMFIDKSQGFLLAILDTTAGKMRMLYDDDIVFLTPNMVKDWNNIEDNWSSSQQPSVR